jgi:hypothetical protein
MKSIPLGDGIPKKIFLHQISHLPIRVETNAWMKNANLHPMESTSTEKILWQEDHLNGDPPIDIPCTHPTHP